MTALADLQAAVAALQTEVTAVVTAVNDLLAAVAAAGGNTAAIETQVTALNAATAALQAAAANDPGPQPAAPATSNPPTTTPA